MSTCNTIHYTWEIAILRSSFVLALEIWTFSGTTFKHSLPKYIYLHQHKRNVRIDTTFSGASSLLLSSLSWVIQKSMSLKNKITKASPKSPPAATHNTCKNLQYPFSSYTKVYSVIYDSGSVPEKSIFSPRETSPANPESIMRTKLDRVEGYRDSGRG